MYIHYCSKGMFHVFHENSLQNSKCFSCANIIAQGLSNDQSAFKHDELNNVPLEHRSDGGWNGPLYTYVDIP